MFVAIVACCWFWYCARMWACGNGGWGCTPYVWWMIVCVNSCWRLFELSSTRFGLLIDIPGPTPVAWLAWWSCSCLIICCCCDKSSALSGCWNCDLMCGCPLLNDEKIKFQTITQMSRFVKASCVPTLVAPVVREYFEAIDSLMNTLKLTSWHSPNVERVTQDALLQLQSPSRYRNRNHDRSQFFDPTF